MSLDAEKTFDSVRWSLLYKVLLQFGFDATIIETFAALYNKPTLRYKINGDLTKSGHSRKEEQDKATLLHPVCRTPEPMAEDW